MDEETGAHTKLMTLKVTQLDKRMGWELAKELVEKSSPGDNLNLSGIYRTVSKTPTLRVITKEEGSPAYLVWWMQNKRRFLSRWNPHTTRHFINRSEKLSLEQAEPLWAEAYEDLAFDQDQTSEVHVIMGPVLRHWAKLRATLGVEGGGWNRHRLVMKFVNEVALDGTRIIGILVPSEKVYDLEEAFTGYSLRPDGLGGGPLSPSGGGGSMSPKLRSGMPLESLPPMGLLDMDLGIGGTQIPPEGLNPDGSWGPGDTRQAAVAAVPNGAAAAAAGSGLMGAPGMDAQATAAAIGGNVSMLAGVDRAPPSSTVQAAAVVAQDEASAAEEGDTDAGEELNEDGDEDEADDVPTEQVNEELPFGDGNGLGGIGRLGDDTSSLPTGPITGAGEEDIGYGEDHGVGDDEAMALLAAEQGDEGDTVLVPDVGAGAQDADEIDFAALQGFDL